ncbi:MAG: RNA polymerase sigma-70 factor, ECF subfamily, putative [uncultured Aureispira sp.]|uniref:RNA polymerase sigma-70 factor, ECF subfamily, putative n=1 Tax=uncultured Aureispira sp. TaxID=1331704 RepID=A0A6S6ULK5_9BACT|nr:MAG: RNA polymerase sigma-70 factor, ECF subfamily, putative [uncultured Aureispira sp.]
MLEKKDNQILEAIKRGDPKVLEKLYDDNRQPFLVWAAQTYQCETEDAVGIYQKAYTILYLNVRNGKLTSLTSTIKTYLFSIGKNLFREKFRDKHNRLVNLDDVSNSSIVENQLDNNIFDTYKDEHQKELVRHLLNEIGNPCKKLLNLMFIQGYSAEAVVHEMGYSDERVVRKRKSLCLKKLREMVAEKKDSTFL